MVIIAYGRLVNVNSGGGILMRFWLDAEQLSYNLFMQRKLGSNPCHQLVLCKAINS